MFSPEEKTSDVVDESKDDVDILGTTDNVLSQTVPLTSMGGKEDERKIEDQNVADMASTAPAGLGKHGLDKKKEGLYPTRNQQNLS